MPFLTKFSESFKKFESEPLRNRRIFGDHDPRRRRGDFFSLHSTGVAEPRRASLTLGESVNFTFAAMRATQIEILNEECCDLYRVSPELVKPNSGVNRYLCQQMGWNIINLSVKSLLYVAHTHASCCKQTSRPINDVVYKNTIIIEISLFPTNSAKVRAIKFRVCNITALTWGTNLFACL